MKADEIREFGRNLRVNNGVADKTTWADGSAQTAVLIEIAAQLAVSNEYIKIYSNPPMVFEGANITPDEFPDLSQPVTFRPVEPRATLRDQFAMAALQGYIGCDPSGTSYWQTGPQMVDAAMNAYVWANVMLEARK
jgi:hypothetical protein